MPAEQASPTPAGKRGSGSVLGRGDKAPAPGGRGRSLRQHAPPPPPSTGSSAPRVGGTLPKAVSAAGKGAAVKPAPADPDGVDVSGTHEANGPSQPGSQPTSPAGRKGSKQIPPGQRDIRSFVGKTASAGQPRGRPAQKALPAAAPGTASRASSGAAAKRSGGTVDSGPAPSNTAPNVTTRTAAAAATAAPLASLPHVSSRGGATSRGPGRERRQPDEESVRTTPTKPPLPPSRKRPAADPSASPTHRPPPSVRGSGSASRQGKGAEGRPSKSDRPCPGGAGQAGPAAAAPPSQPRITRQQSKGGSSSGTGMGGPASDDNAGGAENGNGPSEAGGTEAASPRRPAAALKPRAKQQQHPKSLQEDGTLDEGRASRAAAAAAAPEPAAAVDIGAPAVRRGSLGAPRLSSSGSGAAALGPAPGSALDHQPAALPPNPTAKPWGPAGVAHKLLASAAARARSAAAGRVVAPPPLGATHVSGPTDATGSAPPADGLRHSTRTHRLTAKAAAMDLGSVVDAGYADDDAFLVPYKGAWGKRWRYVEDEQGGARANGGARRGRGGRAGGNPSSAPRGVGRKRKAGLLGGQTDESDTDSGGADSCDEGPKRPRTAPPLLRKPGAAGPRSGVAGPSPRVAAAVAAVSKPPATAAALLNHLNRTAAAAAVTPPPPHVTADSAVEKPTGGAPSAAVPTTVTSDDEDRRLAALQPVVRVAAPTQPPNPNVPPAVSELVAAVFGAVLTSAAAAAGEQLDWSRDPRLCVVRCIRDVLGEPLPTMMNSKHMLSTGVLDGFEVEFRKREGGTRVVTNTGVLVSNGLIRCNCALCCGHQDVTLAAFEAHSGSTFRKPSDYITVARLGLTLRDLGQLVLGEPLCSQGRVLLHFPRPGAALRGAMTSGGGAAAFGAGAGSGQRSLRGAVASAAAEEDARGRAPRRPGAGIGVSGALHPFGPPALIALPPSAPKGVADLLPPLHVMPRTKVPDSGPTELSPVPDAFQLEHWVRKLEAGEHVVATTAGGVPMPTAAVDGPLPPGLSPAGPPTIAALADLLAQGGGVSGPPGEPPVMPWPMLDISSTRLEHVTAGRLDEGVPPIVFALPDPPGACRASAGGAAPPAATPIDAAAPEGKKAAGGQTPASGGGAAALPPGKLNALLPTPAATGGPPVAGGAAAVGPGQVPLSEPPRKGALALVDGALVPLPPGAPTPPLGHVTRVTTMRNKNKHARLFEPGPGTLHHGQRVTYRIQGQDLLAGTIHIDAQVHKSGILCSHCNAVISPSTFEAHAGHKQRRNPYDAITTDWGVTLRDMAARLPPLPEEVNYAFVLETEARAAIAAAAAAARVVANGGKIPSSVSGRMVRQFLMRRIPAFLPGSGRGRGQGGPLGGRGGGRGGRGFRGADAFGYAGGDPEGPQLSALTSSCVVCFDAGFDREGFSDRTVLICDQCEREFHVGCLRKAGHAGLQRLPDGNWYCSRECGLCREALDAQVAAGEAVVSTDGHTLTVMKGRDGSLATSRDLHTVLETLQESFDPIVSSTDGIDLLPSMVLAVEQGDFDFQGMYSLLLKHRGVPVCAGLFRVFGTSLAELPLIATRMAARRKGHAKVLMSVLEQRLRMLHVRQLALPAAHDAIVTWVRGFGFRYMHPLQLQCALAELRLLIFPGTQVLYKSLARAGPPDAFRGVAAGPSALLAAHPAGLPAEIQGYIDQQARAVADDAASQALPLEPWMPAPSSAAVIAGAEAAAAATPGPGSTTPGQPAAAGGLPGGVASLPVQPHMIPAPDGAAAGVVPASSDAAVAAPPPEVPGVFLNALSALAQAFAVVPPEPDGQAGVGAPAPAPTTLSSGQTAAGGSAPRGQGAIAQRDAA